MIKEDEGERIRREEEEEDKKNGCLTEEELDHEEEEEEEEEQRRKKFLASEKEREGVVGKEKFVRKISDGGEEVEVKKKEISGR